MFELPELPYAANALEPVISARTMAFHHGKHHAGYVRALNALVTAPARAQMRLEEIISEAAAAKETKLLNNAAQCWNHSFFWTSMATGPAQPSSALKIAIDAAFGDIAALSEIFSQAGVGHFGSGWVWLATDRSGALEVIATHDAANLLASKDMTPLLVCDLWEHAYYLDYQNSRAGFLDAWFGALPDWAFASAQFEAASSGATGWRHPPPVQ